VLLLELAHVDGGHEALAAVEAWLAEQEANA
jgi:hypothetical protein